MVNKYLTQRKADVDSGELKVRSYQLYEKTVKKLIEMLGRNTFAEDLGPPEFARYKAATAKTAT